jgi:RNA polymerase sigma factor (TIGR02999 family)
MSEVTRILSEIEVGDPSAAAQLLPLVYDELRRLAAHKLAQERPGQTLDATALAHEAYLRLVDVPRLQTWDSRGHFFAAAAEAMRRILVENARRKKRIKHGGSLQRVDLDGIPLATRFDADALLAVNEALEGLGREEPAAAELVKLHFFLGLTLEEAANVLGVSRATVFRQWAYARAWLKLALAELGEYAVDRPQDEKKS